MALPLGKLTILIGAGIVGSVLAKEGRLSNVSDFFSGAFKIALKQVRQDNSTTSTVKPRNDSLMAQVDSLRQELQLLASSRPVTVVTSSGSGASRYGVVIVIVVIGYGYVWLKGWKLPDMMFATKRSLSDACSTMAKQLENVYSSISATKRHLSSRIDRVDSRVDESAEHNAATREKVSELQTEIKGIDESYQSVREAVKSLRSRLTNIEGKQSVTHEGVAWLVDYALSLGNSRTIQDDPSNSSQPVLELPASWAASLPPISSLEPQSPSSNGSHMVQRTLQSTVSASGLKELHGISGIAEVTSSPKVSNGSHAMEGTSNGSSNGSTGSGLFGWRIPGSGGASFLTRTRSAMQSFR